MQHPDEGTIHSWLDSALSAEDAARVESHVAECPQCAAAVAEARGFIAASSRILTALDDVPRGVVPAGTDTGPVGSARRRDFRILWRAAAAVLVVAGGSLIVLREGGQDARVTVSTRDTASFAPMAASATADERMGEGAGIAKAEKAAEGARVAAPQSDAVPVNQRRVAPPTARPGKITASTERDFSGKDAFGRISGSTVGVTGQGVAAGAVVPASEAMQLSANAVRTQGDVLPLKVLQVQRARGSRRTLYEISPTDTVTLTEPEPLLLSGVVETGVGTVRERQSGVSGVPSVAPMRSQPAAAAPRPAPPADSRAADSASVATEATAATAAKASTEKRSLASLAQTQPAAAFTARFNSISWIEPTSGKTLTLSGNLPVERLQEIKRRIEKERSARSP
jgi:hypothetical protein